MAKKKLISETIPVTVHPLFRDKLCYSLSKTGMLYRSLLEKSLADFGIVPPQAGILHILNGYGEYNQNLLGQEMNIDKASMVKFIDGLEKLGMVKRTTDTNDRRAKLVTLTSKGKLIQKKISDDQERLEKEIFKGFKKKDIDYLRDIMPQVLQSVLNAIHEVS
jgi:DNA-binding MarR family transcriptional regulator